MGSIGRLTLYGRIIFVYEMRLDELDCQARFSYTTAADYHELVLSEELRGQSRSAVATAVSDGIRTFDAIVEK
jgi:hypothetical protein